MNLKKFAFLSGVAVVTLCSVVAYLVITFHHTSAPAEIGDKNVVMTLTEEVSNTNVVTVESTKTNSVNVDPYIASGTATYQMVPSKFRSPPVVREEEVKRLLMRPVASGAQ
jgi:hypothetical protein